MEKQEKVEIVEKIAEQIKDIPLWQQGYILGCVETIKGAKPTITIKSKQAEPTKEAGV